MREIKAHIRSEQGKKVGRLRKQGLVPAVLYGPDTPASMLAVSTKDFAPLYRKAGESTLVALQIGEEDKPRTVLIREVQRDPISRSFLHVDFYQMRLDEKLKVTVPLEFINVAPAEEAEGATIVKNLHELEIEALPQDLPSEIPVDLSRLQRIDDAIMVRDLELPAGVRVLAEEDEIIALAAAPTSQEELEALEQPPAEAVEKVEVVGEEKPEEEEPPAPEKETT